MKRLFSFEKDFDSKWYVILPEWTGERADLEMVCGANTMLDILAQGQDFISFYVSTDPVDNPRFVLNFKQESTGGATYTFQDSIYTFEVWLCYVTKFVFGDFPKNLYCY